MKKFCCVFIPRNGKLEKGGKLWGRTAMEK